MRAEWWSRVGVGVALSVAAFAMACTAATDEPTGGLPAPSELTAEAVGMATVRLSWRPASGQEVSAYELQRRADLHGGFTTIESGVPADGSARLAYFDTKVEPDRYYGYRVRAVSRLGARSAMSNIAGAKTSPTPGLNVVTTTTVATAESADPDGYIAVIRGARDTSSIAVASNAQRLISPIARGTYSVVLRGLAVNCAPLNSADTVQTATVTDQGTRTVASVNFTISCRDPRKASIVAVLQTSGDTLDADGLQVVTSGIIREAGTPANERVYLNTQKLSGANGSVRFDNLRPGDYEISIGDIDPPCVLNGDARKTLQPRALAVDTVRFAITCRKVVVVDTAGRPFILRQSWSASSARPGERLALLTALDLRAQPTQQVAGVEALVQFDNAVVRYDSARTTGAFDLTILNRTQPNILALAATNTDGQGRTGNIQIVRSWFTVIGAAGSSVRSSTTVTDILPPQGVSLKTKVRVEDATLTITATGGGPTNQPPRAVISGPTTGVAGTALSFSGSQSSDSDGTISSYAWNFGDNTTATGATASHTYAAAGTYTVRLTVTDNRNDTGFTDFSVVVSAAGGTTGTISGTVTSPQRGALSGVTVTAAGGPAATTSATGTYTIANVPGGSPSVSLGTVPTGCTAPAAQTVTVTAGATVTANFAVTCTATATTGTVSGKISRVSDASGIAGVRILLQPAGGAAVGAVTTAADGRYTVANVPVGAGSSAGTGSITLADLPIGCAAPSSQTYSGLTAGGTATKDIAVTCQTATTGTLTGTITRSTGGAAISGVQITVTPTGAAALPAVTTNAGGVYTVTSVPAGGGNITFGGLPTGCTNPGAQSYTGVVAGASVTRNVTVTCTAQAHTYSLTPSWGAITTSGPTGRQVTLTLAVNMGGAPGRPDINGANADSLAGLTFNIAYNGMSLDWLSRVGLTPNGEFDLNIVNEISPGTANTQLVGAIASTSGQTVGGSVPLIRLTFNIATGFSGAVTPVLTVSEALATIFPINVTTSFVVVPIPTLTIP